MVLKKSAVMCALPVLLAACDGIDLGDWAGSDAAGLDSANLAVPVRAADCSGTGVVGNLSADDFLSVREGPGTQYARFAKLQPGTPVHLCTQANGGKWVGVVYSDDGTLPPEDQCFGSGAASGASGGKCRTGWVAQRYVVDASGSAGPSVSQSEQSATPALDPDGYLYLKCDYRTEYREGDNESVMKLTKVEEGSRIFRTKEKQIDEFFSDGTWDSLCEQSKFWPEPECTTSPLTFRVRNYHWAEDDNRSNVIIIDRKTGKFEDEYKQYGQWKRTSIGYCSVTSDPIVNINTKF